MVPISSYVCASAIVCGTSGEVLGSMTLLVSLLRFQKSVLYPIRSLSLSPLCLWSRCNLRYFFSVTPTCMHVYCTLCKPHPQLIAFLLNVVFTATEKQLRDWCQEWSTVTGIQSCGRLWGFGLEKQLNVVQRIFFKERCCSLQS